MQMLKYSGSIPGAVAKVILTALFVFFLWGCSEVEEKRELQLGDTAPDFAVKDLSGNVIVLSSLKDTPVILRFFETNCKFCKADTPAFMDFYTRNGSKGLVVLYIGSFYESAQSLQNFADELGLIFPVAMDSGGRLADLYNIRAYPQTLFLGPDKKILAAILGGVGEAELEEIMGKYL